MKQIDLRDIADTIHVILTCMPTGARNAGGWSAEGAVREATARIMKILAGAVVLKPDDLVTAGNELAPTQYSAGAFGVTEPWPFEAGCRPPVKPGRKPHARAAKGPHP